MMTQSGTGIKIISQNKRAYHDYHIKETFEAGISLSGTEVKSVRKGAINLKESYVRADGGELYLVGAHISPYEQGNRANKDPLRTRKLLMHKREIVHLTMVAQKEGMTLVPTKCYFRKNRVKIEIGLAQGKKLHDKRDSTAKRDAQRQIDQQMKKHARQTGG